MGPSMAVILRRIENLASIAYRIPGHGTGNNNEIERTQAAGVEWGGVAWNVQLN